MAQTRSGSRRMAGGLRLWTSRRPRWRTGGGWPRPPEVMSQDASTGSRPTLRRGRQSRNTTISLFPCMSTWRAPSKRWCGGWQTALLREGPCSWLDTARSILAPEMPRLRPIRCRFRWRVQSLRLIPGCGRCSLGKGVRGPFPEQGSMRPSTRPAGLDSCGRLWGTETHRAAALGCARSLDGMGSGKSGNLLLAGGRLRCHGRVRLQRARSGSGSGSGSGSVGR